MDQFRELKFSKNEALPLNSTVQFIHRPQKRQWLKLLDESTFEEQKNLF